MGGVASLPRARPLLPREATGCGRDPRNGDACLARGARRPRRREMMSGFSRLAFFSPTHRYRQRRKQRDVDEEDSGKPDGEQRGQQIAELAGPTQPSDSLIPVDRGSGLPLPAALPRRGYLLLRGATHVASAGRARIHERAARRRVMTGSPLHRVVAEEESGPPRCLGRPLVAYRGRISRRVRSRLCPDAERSPSPSGQSTPSAPGMT